MITASSVLIYTQGEIKTAGDKHCNILPSRRYFLKKEMMKWQETVFKFWRANDQKINRKCKWVIVTHVHLRKWKLLSMPQLGLVPAVSHSNENACLHMTELQCPTERHCFTATHRRFVPQPHHPQTTSYHYSGCARKISTLTCYDPFKNHKINIIVHLNIITPSTSPSTQLFPYHFNKVI